MLPDRFIESHPLLIPSQCDLHGVFECTKEFDLNLAVTDTDLVLIHECVSLASTHANLSAYWVDAIAYVLSIMDICHWQRQFFNFERFYPDVVQLAVFGSTEENPIVIVDNAGNNAVTADIQ